MSPVEVGFRVYLMRLSGKCRTGIAAGSPIPIDLMKQLIEKLNLTELTVAYGMSTSSHLVYCCAV